MTSFSRPDLVACPYCGARHERIFLQSYNDLWATYYSDGGSSYAPYKFSGLISRCTLCNQVIAETYNLPSAGQVVTRKIFSPSFWRKLLGLEMVYDLAKPFECPRLPCPELPDWVAATEQFNLSEKLRQAAEIIVMQEYNQLLVTTHQWAHKHFVWKDKFRAKHKQIEDKILAQVIAGEDESSLLLRADILRRRGRFDDALKGLEKVTSEPYLNLKQLLTQWVRDENTVLMAIPNRGEAGYDDGSTKEEE